MEPYIVKQQINSRIESVLHTTNTGERIPFVCLVCGKFLKPREVETISLSNLQQVQDVLEPSNWNPVTPQTASCYNFKADPTLHESLDLSWMEDMLLSPRGCYIKSTDQRRKEGFCVCSKCKMSLHKEMMSRFAIANNYT